MRKRIASSDFWCDDSGNMWHTALYSEGKARKASQTLIGGQMYTDCFFCSFCMSCRSCTNCRRFTRLTEAYGTEDVKMCTNSRKPRLMKIPRLLSAGLIYLGGPADYVRKLISDA